jgi:hypothetical protein
MVLGVVRTSFQTQDSALIFSVIEKREKNEEKKDSASRFSTLADRTISDSRQIFM